MAEQEQQADGAHTGIGADQGNSVQHPEPTASAAAAASAVGSGALAAAEASGAQIGGDKATRPLRKKVLKTFSTPPVQPRDEIDGAELATVVVTSESPDHPIDHAFDGKRGPGGTRWMAEEGGEQTIVVIFDSPANVHGIFLEVEELSQPREQELWLDVSCDGGASFREVRRQGFNFSPPDTNL